MLPKPIVRDPGPNDKWQVLALGRRVTRQTAAFFKQDDMTYPAEELLNRMFGAIDRNDPDKGGLGLSRDVVFEHFPQKTLENWPTDDYRCDKWYERDR